MGWRRTVRAVIGWSVGPPLVLAAAAAGTLLALMYAPPGRALLVRAASSWMTGRIAGELHVGGIGGSLLRHVVLDDVVLRDSTGALVVSAARIEARYLLPELLAGRIVLREVAVESPTIHLVRLRRERWNYQEVFRSGQGGDGGPPPLVELHDLTIRDATLRVDVPTTPGPPREPISRNGARPAQPEVRDSPDGPIRIYRATGLAAEFPVIRVSTPDDDPLRVEVAHFAARLSDPAVEVVDATGEIVQGADSLQFALSRAALPGTVVAGSGAVRWPQDTIRYDFSLTADTVDLADLRWVQPDFPSWTGTGRVIAFSSSNRHTDFRLEALDLGDGQARATGRVVAMLDETRGFGVRDLDLTLRAVPLGIVRPYLDTLPFAGTLTGTLQADGYREELATRGTLDFVDASVAGTPTSRLAFDGTVQFGGEAGAVFRQFALRGTRLDLQTVQQSVPAVALPGELRLDGVLNGPWQDAQFRGIAEHHAPGDGLSRLVGTVRFDTRGDVLGLEMDARLDPLSFDALRTGYPDLTGRGTMTGHVAASGRLDSLSIAAEVEGEFGALEAEGTVALEAPRYAADSLALVLRRFDADALLGTGTATALNGRLVVRGVLDSLRQPRGVVTADLGQSRIGGATVEEIRGLARSDGRLITLASAEVRWPDGRITADGTIGWTAADSGRLEVSASATRLTPFDSLARATLELTPDSAAFRPLDGEASGRFTVAGSIERPAIAGRFTAADLVLDAWSVAALEAEVRTDSLSTRGLQLDATADTVRVGETMARELAVTVGGRDDSLSIRARGILPDARIGLAGWRVAGDSVARLGLDSLALALPHQHWTLAAPVRARSSARGIVLEDTARLVTPDGSGTIELHGSVPGRAAGELEASVVGLDLTDVYALLQRDTSAVSGLVSADVRLGGTRTAPLLRGNAMLTGPVFRDVTPPLARAVFDYREQLLRSNVTFWKTGAPVLEVDVALPFDLALASRAERRLPGPIEIRALADSADLSLLQALTTNLTQTRGALDLDLAIGGTWAAPRLDGTLDVIEGRMTLPSLNVRYGPIFGHARFTGDSMVVDSLLLSSGEGDMHVDGSVRFVDLAEPVLDLTFASEGFLAMNVPEFLVLRPTGTARLTGPLLQPVLRGNTIRLDNSTLYFTDLITKNVINLEDPAYANLVDLEELRRQRLGAAFQNRFLDSLRIDNLRFQLGTNVRLYSEDADIQMEGAVTVQKTGRQYLLNGDLSTPRGTYTLRLGGILTTEFDVERGTVRYFGTPDLNASIDLQARHMARTEDGSELPVIARITGTIEVPKVELSSPNSQLAQIDIVSFLLFGRPSAQVGSGSNGVALQTAMGLLSGELERTIGQGSGLDLFEFRPGVTLGSGGNAAFSRVAIGKQLGQKWFVTANAGFCLGGEAANQISAKNFGASLEYRFAQNWRVQASAEPVATCATNRLTDAFNTIARRYQIGADLLWEREY